ncbi:MAG: hypothetical protein ACR2GH_08890 [Pseudonocardia sp.]
MTTDVASPASFRQYQPGELPVLACPALARRGVDADATMRDGGLSACPHHGLNLGFQVRTAAAGTAPGSGFFVSHHSERPSGRFAAVARTCEVDA